MAIKLVSINIEGSRHLEERVIPFLKDQDPDVATLQEVFLADVKMLEQETGMKGLFAPMARIGEAGVKIPADPTQGILILSKLEVSESGYETYFKFIDKSGDNSEDLPTFFSTKEPDRMNRLVNWVKVRENDLDKDLDKEYLIATTHFTWSEKGRLSPLQEEAYQGLEQVLDSLPVSVLTGDFNAPRGGEIFSRLSQRYKDNIPQDVETTIDNTLHKAPDEIMLVVDGLFSSNGYQLSNVQVVDGVSDHKAVVGLVDLV